MSSARTAPRSSTRSAGSSVRSATARLAKNPRCRGSAARAGGATSSTLAAADRDPATDLAQHVAIEHVQHQRPRGSDPDEALPARPLEEPNLRLGLGGAGVHHEGAAGGDPSREPPDRPDVPSNVVVGRHAPGEARTSPRSSRSRSAPTRLAATRETGHARSSCSLWVWRPRIRARSPFGYSSISSPVCRQSPVSVPVATVPAPLIAKTRSTNSRVLASSGAGARRDRGRAPRSGPARPRRSATTPRRSARPRARCPRSARAPRRARWRASPRRPDRVS